MSMDGVKGRLAALALIVLFPLGLGVASPASGGTPLTKSQFITKANALCAAAAAQFRPNEKQFKGQTMTPQLITRFVADLVPVIQEQLDKTKGLTPPSSSLKSVQKMLATDQGELKAFKANPQLMAGKTSPFVLADNLAGKLGLLGAPGSSVCTK